MPSPSTRINMAEVLDKMPETALIQLVYVSSLTITARLNNSIFEEVKAHARKYNQHHNITGILCYGNGRFLQCIEGEKAQVVELQQRIFSDKRHRNIKVLLLQATDQRRFLDWRMRLLFLERWLWSPETKKQVTQLSPFLPFTPHNWSTESTERFLQVIKTFDTPPHVKTAGINYHALGNMFRHVIAPHQAFLTVQGILILLIALALILFYL